MITCPAKSSHANMSAEERRQIGLDDSLLRMSVGIENVDELLADIQQALTKVS